MKRSCMPARKTGLKATTIRASGKRLAQRRSTGNATVAQSHRWAVMRELGCMACRANQPPMRRCPMDVEIHHILSGGRRIGHDATIALCHWHHQAKRFPSTTSGYSDQAKLYGPSLEREPRRFHEMYGAELDILAAQNDLILKGASK